MSAASPLRWLPAAVLHAIENVVDECWARWQADWHCAGKGRVQAVNAADSGAKLLTWHAIPSREGAIWSEQAPLRSTIAHALFGERSLSAGGIAARVVERAESDLLQALKGLAGPAGGPQETARLFDRWSGAVVLRLPLNEGVIRILVAPEPAEALAGAEVPAGALGQLPPLDPLAAVIESRAVRASVELAECDVAIGELRDLAVGDVLRLQHLLSAPVAVRVAGRAICNARLGRRGIAKAVALSRAAD